MINRYLESIIGGRMGQGNSLIWSTSSRQDYYAENLLARRDDVLWLNGDELDVRNLFENVSSTMLKTIIGKKSVVVIDERIH